MSFIKSQDIVWTQSLTVGCSGDAQSGLGHPLVYYTLTKKEQALCGYCGRIFRLESDQAREDGAEQGVDSTRKN